ncbi:hypothetical protein EV182_000195 [Spiromyces aspiralis]|uniref:Uncharacterized protein n=1 Tax=Spiromyces aspiralis TaxID=68401 RepID=A0ACC1HHM5_9FUNG|nr:hypothetical protein EV182_000195 [Spiromyces aspiralis]
MSKLIRSTAFILGFDEQQFYATLFVTLFLALALWVWRPFSPISRIPTSVPDLLFPIRVVFLRLNGTWLKETMAMHRTHGKLVRTGRNEVSITDLKEAKRIFATHTFRKALFEEVTAFGVENTFTTPNPLLNHQRRRLLRPAFTIANISSIEDRILNAGPLSLKRKLEADLDRAMAESGCDRIRFNYYFDIYYAMFDTIGELGFGGSFGILHNHDYLALHGIEAMNRLAMLQALMPSFKDLIPRLAYDPHNHIIKLRSFIETLIDKRLLLLKELEDKAKLTGQPIEKPNDLLQNFIDRTDFSLPSSKEGGGGSIKGKLNRDELMSELTIQVSAGPETSSSTMHWALFFLQAYPECYSKVVNEIRSKFPNKAKPIRYSTDHNELPYLEAVIWETLRILPVASNPLIRSVPESEDGKEPGAVICGYRVPPGTYIFMSAIAIHHDPDLWEEPERFMPERFLGEEGIARRKNLFAFSSGARECPGKNFALSIMFMFLANILRDYDLEIPEDVPFGPHVINPETGYPKVLTPQLAMIVMPADPKRHSVLWLKRSNIPTA